MKKPNRVWVVEYRFGNEWRPDIISVYLLKKNAEEAITTTGASRKSFRVTCYEAKESK